MDLTQRQIQAIALVAPANPVGWAMLVEVPDEPTEAVWLGERRLATFVAWLFDLSDPTVTVRVRVGPKMREVIWATQADLASGLV